jgi:hypothetical protein
MKRTRAILLGWSLVSMVTSPAAWVRSARRGLAEHASHACGSSRR